MKSAIACPPTEELAQLLTGGLAAERQDECVRHMDSCECCQAKLESIAVGESNLSQVVEQNQSFADVYNMLGIVYHDQGQFARAQRAFEAALRLNPAYTEAALNLAVIYNDMGKYREAKEVYQAALLRQRNSPGKLDPFVTGKIANMYADIADVFADPSRIIPRSFTEISR